MNVEFTIIHDLHTRPSRLARHCGSRLFTHISPYLCCPREETPGMLRTISM